MLGLNQEGFSQVAVQNETTVYANLDYGIVVVFDTYLEMIVNATAYYKWDIEDDKAMLYPSGSYETNNETGKPVWKGSCPFFSVYDVKKLKDIKDNGLLLSRYTYIEGNALNVTKLPPDVAHILD